MWHFKILINAFPTRFLLMLLPLLLLLLLFVPQTDLLISLLNLLSYLFGNILCSRAPVAAILQRRSCNEERVQLSMLGSIKIKPCEALKLTACKMQVPSLWQPQNLEIAL